MTLINTNLNALSAQNALATTQRSMSQSMAQLSSGNRITSAADDAAGLAIGNKLTTQIRSLDMAVRNANDGISMLQTADGASASLTDMLVRMKELAIQSANDVYSQDQRDGLQAEMTELQKEMLNVMEKTEWNGMALLDGAAGASGEISLQIGPRGDDVITVSMGKLNTGKLSSAQSLDISTQSGANTAIATIDLAIAELDVSRGTWGAASNRLVHAADNATQVSMNSQAARSQIMDTDYAQMTAELARAMILDQAGTAMLSQANQQPMYVLALLR